MESKGGSSGGSGSKCGRWNPTAEQVEVLSSLFRSGLRTPTTDQIQRISNHLSFYGKIESKNVFYWFQNHKARDRHNKRRKLSSASFHHHHHHHTNKDLNVLHSQSLAEMYQVSEPENNNNNNNNRVIETLQLFPLSSFGESESEKLRVHENDENGGDHDDDDDDTMFSCTLMGEQMEYPPLDLRLSFL